MYVDAKSFRIRIRLTYRDKYSYSEKNNEDETNPIPPLVVISWDRLTP